MGKPKNPNRTAAQIAGDVTYVGDPCRNGHTLRYTRSTSCRQCDIDRIRNNPIARKKAIQKYESKNKEIISAKASARRKLNPEKYRANSKKWRENNPDRSRLLIKQWQHANRDHVLDLRRIWKSNNRERLAPDNRARATEWAKANPEKRREQHRNRRALKKGATGSHTASDVALILELQNHRCAYCDESENLHLDHATPLVRGGSNGPLNLQWLCAWHNMSKGAKTDAEYRKLIGLPFAHPPLLAIYRAALWI